MSERSEMQARAETAPAAKRSKDTLPNIIARAYRQDGAGLTPGEVLALTDAALRYVSYGRTGEPNTEDALGEKASAQMPSTQPVRSNDDDTGRLVAIVDLETNWTCELRETGSYQVMQGTAFRGSFLALWKAEKFLESCGVKCWREIGYASDDYPRPMGAPSKR